MLFSLVTGLIKEVNSRVKETTRRDVFTAGSLTARGSQLRRNSVAL